MFKNNIQALQRQLSEVSERSSSNRAALSQLRAAGSDIQSSQGSIQGMLDANQATLGAVNGTLRSYSSTMEGLQDDTARLQTELQASVDFSNEKKYIGLYTVYDKKMFSSTILTFFH